MTDLTLKGLSPSQLAMLGDAAFLAGDLALAQGFYRNLVKAAPTPQAHARLGFTTRPNSRCRAMLEVLRTLESSMPGARVFVGEGIATWLKTPAFTLDRKFMELAARDSAIAPAGVANWHWNLQTVLWAVEQTRYLPGDCVELGVYKGHTTKFVADYVDFAKWPKRWWLYDTFEGVPPEQRDAGRENMTAAAYGQPFTYEEVQERFASYGNVEVVKGRVPDVLAERCPDAISFMHIDLNNSVAEIAALDALYDRLAPGGVIVFDDYQWSSSWQQYKAEAEWFRSRGLAVYPAATGQGVFVKPPA